MLLWAPDDGYEIVQVLYMAQIDSWNRGDKTDDAMILNTKFRLAPFTVTLAIQLPWSPGLAPRYDV